MPHRICILALLCQYCDQTDVLHFTLYVCTSPRKAAVSSTLTCFSHVPEMLHSILSVMVVPRLIKHFDTGYMHLANLIVDICMQMRRLIKPFRHGSKLHVGPSIHCILPGACLAPITHQTLVFPARGADAVLRSLEQLQQASQPLYANLFIPFSNQPDGICLFMYFTR